MAGGGSSELRALAEWIRQLDARVTACEKDLVRLARRAAELAPTVEDVPASRARAEAQAMTIVGGAGKSKKAGRP